MSRARAVVVASSDALWRDAAARFLGTSDGWACAGAVSDGLAAVAAVARLRPDALLADAALGRLGAAALARQVARRWPAVAVVVVGDVDAPEATVLGRGATASEVLAALARGPRPAPELGPDKGRGGVSLLRALTTRERLVLRRLAEGRDMAEIAADLGVSEHTVRTHMQNLYAKLGLHSRLEVVRFALRHGLVTPGAAER